MTPHINANKEDIAKTVIMPGDPKRATVIANKYLTDVKLVSDVRGMLAYTGYFNNKKVTVMASGMGIPSMGIYSYELFKFYDVDNIIRVGSCGSYTGTLNLYDLILVEASYSESSFARVQNGCQDKVVYSSTALNEAIKNEATESSTNLVTGKVHCSDVFYKENNNYKQLNEQEKCLAVEMETFALFHNANVLNKQASAILTVSDSFVTGAKTSSEERENNFMKMVELALNAF